MTDIATAATFRLADVFGKTFAIYRRRFPAFIVVTVIVSIPYYLAHYFVFETVVYESPFAYIAALYALIVPSILTQSLAHGAVMHGVVQDRHGLGFSVGALLRTFWRHLIPTLGVAVCTTLIILFGWVLLFVPGIILACGWYVSMPVCIAERTGVFTSMSRSSFLTKGHRWQVFGTLLMLFVARAAVNAIINLTPEPTGATAPLIFSLALRGILGAFEGVLAGVFYYDLRAAKEGIDIDKIAGVFD